MSDDKEARTWDGKFTMKKWWELTDAAQKSRRKLLSFENLIHEGDLVFDIGANRGVLTLVFRWLGARVIAVEPLFTIAPQLVREFEWRFGDDPMVTTVPKAISPNPSSMMWIHKNHPYLSSGSSPWITKSAHKGYYHRVNTTPKKAPTTTIDALIEEYGTPVFIKVDVEGAENAVIRTLSRPVAAMNMEFHEDWIPEAAMVHMMRRADYEWNYSLNFTGGDIMPEWTTIPLMLAYMHKNLTKKGPLSWGDIFCRRKDMEWNQPRSS